MLSRNLNISFNRRTLEQSTLPRPVKTETILRTITRLLTLILLVLSAPHLGNPLVNKQIIWPSDVLGDMALPKAADPVQQVIVRCQGGSMEVLTANHGTLLDRWLLGRMQVSGLSNAPLPATASRRRTARELLRVAQRGAIEEPELSDDMYLMEQWWHLEGGSNWRMRWACTQVSAHQYGSVPGPYWFCDHSLRLFFISFASRICLWSHIKDEIFLTSDTVYLSGQNHWIDYINYIDGRGKVDSILAYVYMICAFAPTDLSDLV